MSNHGHVKSLKNILLFEAEKEKEIRSDIFDRISKNSLMKHDNSSIISGKEGEQL